MIKKNVAIALFVIALVLVSFVAYDYVSSDEKVSSDKIGSLEDDSGNGKVGVTILPPTIEDKANGS